MKILRLIFASMLLALAAVSCSKEEYPYIRVSQSEFVVGRDFGEISFGVESNCDWSVAVLPLGEFDNVSDFKASSLQGYPAIKNITVRYGSNKSYDRGAVIALYNADCYTAVRVIQPGDLGESPWIFEDPEPPLSPEDSLAKAEYLSSVSFIAGDFSTRESITVDGLSGITAIKLGTSEHGGEATLRVPKGTKFVKFYGVGWNDVDTYIEFSISGIDLAGKKVPVNRNPGAAGYSPYSITVGEDDMKTFTFDDPIPITVPVTVRCPDRAFIFGLKASPKKMW